MASMHFGGSNGGSFDGWVCTVSRLMTSESVEQVELSIGCSVGVSVSRLVNESVWSIAWWVGWWAGRLAGRSYGW